MSSFLAIPPEVMDVVCDVVDRDDLPALRLTCKGLCVIFSEPFARAYLEDISLIFSEYSLAALLKLTAHPVLGRQLRRLTFGTHYLQYKYDMPGEFQTRAEALEKFVKSGAHVDMLSRALKNLKDRELDVTLGLHDDLAEVTKPGSGQYKKVPFKKAYGFQDSYSGLTDYTFLQANPGQRNAYGFNDAIDEFLFQPKRPGAGISTDLRFDRTLDIIGHQPSLNTAWNIFFSTYGPRLVFSTTSEHAQEYIEPLRRARFQSDFAMDCGSSLESCFALIGLREFSLHKCFVDLGALMEFLGEQRRTLRWLVLRNLYVEFDDEDEDPEGHRGPLALLQQLRGMRLEFLMMQELISIRDETRVIGPRLGMFQGDRIQNALQTYIQREQLILNFIENDQPIPDALIDPQIPEIVRERLSYYDDPTAI
ncbi:hypothetical protein D6D13_08211 [Aureobasidium pullulans]|uniref:F-box domain-containing protein n=1 Tax=Aureobasidium pullulans TaxID=5580 RepID=A0A4S9CA89_AURPU|nr:hypothetical protein D6D13_08211 [Aureobasidium pullulans]